MTDGRGGGVNTKSYTVAERVTRGLRQVRGIYIYIYTSERLNTQFNVYYCIHAPKL